METKTKYLSDKIISLVMTSAHNGAARNGVTEEVIASRFKISRTPVREVLKHLEHDDLIQTRPYRGITFKTFSPDDVRHIYGVRIVLEELAVRDAVRKITAKVLKQLKSYAREYKEAISRGDIDQSALADLRFHEQLLELSGNWYLVKLVKKIRMINTIADIGAREAALSNDGKYDLNPYSHDTIIEAIVTGEPETAAVTLRNHILWSRDRTLKAMEEDQTKKKRRQRK